MKKYYMIAVAVLCLASCADNKENIPAAVKSGDEVAFSVSMPAKTRTAYGDLGTTSRPVYWKDGDLIEVASPQCMDGRNVAQYKVNTEGSENLNYAKSLDRTGAYGVQWGETAATDCKFYAVYPSSEMTINGSSVVANLSIASTQTVTLKKNADGNAYEPDTEDMVNNIKCMRSHWKAKHRLLSMRLQEIQQLICSLSHILQYFILIWQAGI